MQSLRGVKANRLKKILPRCGNGGYTLWSSRYLSLTRPWPSLANTLAAGDEVLLLISHSYIPLLTHAHLWHPQACRSAPPPFTAVWKWSMWLWTLQQSFSYRNFFAASCSFGLCNAILWRCWFFLSQYLSNSTIASSFHFLTLCDPSAKSIYCFVYGSRSQITCKKAEKYLTSQLIDLRHPKL